ncbi:hypothetical protein W97_09231 [Coniosporium apollinis CBS 100218]|uniref:GTP 3',8-cyclase n=1 Tax=Coniosporium apollinis (strain CBS 100218) TaxID=1168221 RepID=R7Z7P6_CONA1|nr:uncharacterized protein W97_09231 [Coniosporium apollinis CBS 100218]EON69966.1 hypothetical protein W97_09231 [Coniosporium apollinis CBS 100218]
MAEPLFLRPGVAAVRCAKRLSTPCGNRILRAQRWQYKTTRGIATAAAVQEPVVDFPSQSIELPPQQPERNRKDDLKHAKPFSDFLTDTFNRQHDYLRISITERCNLRCLYCMPEEGVPLSPPSHLLTTPEITYLSALFVSQGVTKIRLTGGEPTVRSDILPLMRSIGALRSRGLKELALTTNGISLHRKLDAMVEAGLTGVNLSLDTLDPFQFQIMTRRRGFEAVMKSVERILEMNKLGAGVKLKINCVVMRGLNEREILPFVEMTRDKDIEVRFIEYMPFDGNRWSQGKMLPYREMLEIIRGKYPEVRRVQGHKNDTSKTFGIPGFVGRLGFITSMTHNFCGSCNRLRITSDGNLKVCLFGNAEVSLRDLLRKDNSGLPMDEQAFEALKQVEMDRRQGLLGETPLGFSARERELLDVIGMAVKRKKEKHAGMGALENMKNRPMILIGEVDEGKRLPAKLPFPPRISLRRTSYNIIAAPSSPWTLISTTLLPSNRLPTIHSLTHHAHFSTTSCAAKPSLKTTWVSSLRSSLSQRSASVDAAPTHTSGQQLAAKAEDTRNLQRNKGLVRRTNNSAPLWGGRGQQWKKVAGKGWERKKAKMARKWEGREGKWESMGGVIGVGDSRKGGAGKGESKKEEYARKAAERAARRAERKRQGDEAEMVAADEAAMVGMEEGEQGMGEKGALWKDAAVTPEQEVEQEQPRPDPPARLTRQQRLRARAAGKGREMSEEDDAFDTQGVREPRLDVLMKRIEKREAAGPIGRMMEMEMEAKMDEEMEERNKRRMTVLEAWEREVEAEKTEAEKTEAGKGGIEKQEPQEKRTKKAEAESSRDELEQELWRQWAANSEAFELTTAWIQTHNPDPAIFVPKPPWTKRDIAEAKGAKAMLLKTQRQKARENGAEKLRTWMERTKPTVEKTETGPAEAEMTKSGKMRAGTEGPDTTDAQQRAGFATYNPPVRKIGEYKGRGLADGEHEAETQIRRKHTGSPAASKALEPDTESQRKAQADKPWKLYDNFIDSTDDVAEYAPASTGGEETSHRKAAAEGNKDAYKPAEAEIFVVQANENKPTSLGVTRTNITAQRRAVVAKPAIPLIDRTAEDPFTESKTTRKRKAAPKADENEPDMLVGENSEEPALTIERRTASEEVLRDAPKPTILAHGAISEAKKEWFRLQISKRDGQVRELENQINSVEKYVSLIEEKRRRRWGEAVAASRLQNVRRRVLDLAEKVWDNHAAIRGMKGQLGAIMLPVRARQEIPSMEGKVEESEQTLRSLDEEVIRAGVLIRALRAGLVQLTQAMPVVDNTTTTAVHDTADKPHAVASVAEMDEISPGAAESGEAKREDCFTITTMDGFLVRYEK